MTVGRPVTVEKDMAVTHNEFLRGLKRLLAVGGAASLTTGTGDTLRIPWGGGTVDILLGPQRQRRLGMLSLPQLRVVLTFTGLSLAEREQFIAEFDRRFQRGGG